MASNAPASEGSNPKNPAYTLLRSSIDILHLYIICFVLAISSIHAYLRQTYPDQSDTQGVAHSFRIGHAVHPDQACQHRDTVCWLLQVGHVSPDLCDVR